MYISPVRCIQPNFGNSSALVRQWNASLCRMYLCLRWTWDKAFKHWFIYQPVFFVYKSIHWFYAWHVALVHLLLQWSTWKETLFLLLPLVDWYANNLFEIHMSCSMNNFTYLDLFLYPFISVLKQPKHPFHCQSNLCKCLHQQFNQVVRMFSFSGKCSPEIFCNKSYLLLEYGTLFYAWQYEVT